ncbi:hypothetical protein BU24DRAFT_451452 [Aaosphaeria arxii CBS 175.79]|uniref:Rhodopsin domain-containing protein n=1 Tax=Aaosphaeria arxii CBS 175.79 TaxID=1450172 RepID=A0A6A5XPX1_9PLEO|nr:uncharacterized protein BU24DRAFT_451452 [Aaosphaeria arxii CBS 175.79]KAF2014394.1 hypothetical protein BU24DRAFT_451452 [Aaosphaeria arxii CBS 175.79]
MASITKLPPDENRGPLYLGVMIACLVLSVTFIALRTSVRLFMVKKLDLDDWFMLAALPFMIVNQGLSYVSLQYGMGRHIFFLGPPDIMNAIKYNAIAQIFNITTFYFVKASIVLFLLRLVTHLHKTKRMILWISFGLLTAMNVEALIVSIFQCQPLQKQWNPTSSGICWNRNVFQYSAYALAAVTILTDVVYLVLPIVYLWDLRVPTMRKVGIFALLGVGCVSMVCSIVTIPWLRDLSITLDVTYEIVPLACLKFAELNVAVWVGCVPALQPLFRKLMGPGSTMPDPESGEKNSHRLLAIKRSQDTGSTKSSAHGTMKSEYEVLDE